MKKLFTPVAVCALFSTITFTASAQNVGINTTGATPNAAAILDLNTGNAGTKGFLPEQVALTATNSAGPLTLPPTGLIVYNTATAGVSPTNVTPGYYFNAGTALTPNWVQFVAGNSNSNNIGGWLLNGNTGTNPALNFVGTTDANALNFRTNNAQRMTILSSGLVGINITPPTAQLEVYAISGTHGIYGHTPNTGAYVAYETPFSFGVPLQTIQGAGVWAANPLANYTSMFSQSSGAANIAADINFSSVWIATYNYVQNASNVYSPMAVYGQLNNTGGSLAAYENAIEGYNNFGATPGNNGVSVGVMGVASSKNQTAWGIYGSAYQDQVTYYGGGGAFYDYSYANVLQDYAFVATNTGNKIIGTGAVSEIIPTPTHGRVTLVCPESPEYWYQDYGTVQMVSGKAHVNLDPILADVIIVNDSNPIRVFCTPENMPYFNGVTIMNKTTTSFDIVELNGGIHSGTIDYQIVAKPKTNYGQGRFHQAPGPVGTLENVSAAQAKNQSNPALWYHWPSDPQVYNYVLPKQQPVSANKNANGR